MGGHQGQNVDGHQDQNMGGHQNQNESGHQDQNVGGHQDQNVGGHQDILCRTKNSTFVICIALPHGVLLQFVVHVHSVHSLLEGNVKASVMYIVR